MLKMSDVYSEGGCSILSCQGNILLSPTHSYDHDVTEASKSI